MPSKHSLKIYADNSYYHIYNRGVEKRSIFQDQQDYGVFLSYLKEYLLPKNEKEFLEKLSDQNTSYKERDKILKLLRLSNFAEEITLLAYCLMSNHFHLLIKQNSAESINKFMKSLCTRYVMYFNRKYKRIGPLFQDIYKAVMVESDEQLLYLTSYIHRNPLALQGSSLQAYTQPTSLPEYLGQRETTWVHPEEILPYFSRTNLHLSYQAFVEQTEDISPIQDLVIDD